MIWNVDNEISAIDIMNNLGIPSEYTEDALSSSNFAIKDLNKLSGIGANFGLTFRYQATESFAIQPELLVSYRGRSVEASVTGSNLNDSNDDYYDSDDYGYSNNTQSQTETVKISEIEVNQWFIDVPVLFRFQTAMGLFFNIGPVLSLNIDSKLKKGIVSIDVDDYTTTFVFGAIGGLGYSLNLSNGNTIDFDLRLHMGFTNIINDEIDIKDDDAKIKIDGTKVINPKDMNISLGIAY